MGETEGEHAQYTLNKSVFSHVFISFFAKRAGDAIPQYHSRPLLDDWFFCCPPTLSSVRFYPSAAYISSVLPLATRRILPSFSFGFYVPVHAASESSMTDLASSCRDESRSCPSTILYEKPQNIFCTPLKPQSVPKARKLSSHFLLQHFPYDTTYTQSGPESC